MDNIIEIQFDYLYYSKRRVPPLFISTDELLSYSYDGFCSRMLQEVPHIAKMLLPAESLRMILAEENRPEIDLSHKYFQPQRARLVNKGLKTIVIRIAANESPLPAQPTQSSNSTCKSQHLTGQSRSRRCLDVSQNVAQNNVDKQGNLKILCVNDNSYNLGCSTTINSSPEPVLPLERHVKRYEEIIQNIDKELTVKKIELKDLDNKLERANMQNTGHLSTCGNCHLKLGHTRKSCHFSPCKSAFSCGILSKHANQKSNRANINKDVQKLESQLRKAKHDLESATSAVERINNSADKRIEDIVLNEQPHRYSTSCGRRNWLILNKDVALLQSKLKGTLPTRKNVLSLLHSVVNKESQMTHTATSTQTRRDTDHRMAPQKRVLEEQFSIQFPTKRQNSAASSNPIFVHSQEKDDFRLALQLQQAEMESTTENESSSTAVEVFQHDIDETQGATSDEEYLQMEAEAAAALLHLQKRKSKE